MLGRMTPLLKVLAVGAALATAGYLAICTALYFSQRSYIYYPVGRNGLVPAMSLDGDGARLVVSRSEVRGHRAVLYFGGNAEDVSLSIDELERSFPGASVYALHYRGYGGSGGSPSEKTLTADARSLFDHVSGQHDDIVVVGRSLGSAIAVQLAATRPVHRLVLVTPFHSLSELAARSFPWIPVRWLLQDEYESWQHAASVKAPTTIIIADRDEVIPAGSAAALASAFPSETPVQVVTLEGAGHNTLSGDERYLAALAGGEGRH